ncbi:MAG TPA: hypothetical protein PKO33_01980, partial [Pyrinomonadaceae bacterium]|nr:hypothetical protein [Pyrinomonadaceae bacterium]
MLAVAASAQRSRQINEIQGDKDISPYVREIVRVTGIVTARTRAGFFIQNPDDKVDDNPKTSEAIYVFTKTEPGGEATTSDRARVPSLTGNGATGQRRHPLACRLPLPGPARNYTVGSGRRPWRDRVDH